jgi:hypothetical protein
LPTSQNADNPNPPPTATGTAPAPPPRDRPESWLRQLGAQDAIKESVEELLAARIAAGETSQLPCTATQLHHLFAVFSFLRRLFAYTRRTAA